MKRPTGPITGSALIAISLLFPDMAFGQPRRNADPNWPCQQIKVPELSLAAVWSGPSADPKDTAWQDNKPVADLVGKIAPRRQTLSQAQALIDDFARSAASDKQRDLPQVVVGLFTVLNQERESVIAGLDRFGGRQKELAAEIRAGNEKLRALQADSTADPKAVQQLTQLVTWQAEIFQDRRQALTFACDVPNKIEQRLFSLARYIQQQLD